MRQIMRALVPAAVVVAVLPLAACDTWSSKCDTDNTCKIKIQGDQFHDFPRPYDKDHGLKSADRIRLVSAKQGGEALIQAGGVESTCTQGSSFQIVDTTITCDVVGDDKVELTTTRP
ncbi:hypothetical protein [Janibacter hoylei]|uniref:Lipoprotein n=1 Tax=Janibacter hoylei PVAS-1 TaxID=1210046 RepID=K1ENU8_9MICO|nr:hypothetical protein [Janibacter hoylei]EKA60928.1 hypothetical protein B277_10079 [Janibacter hoylei PVAS-1]MCW4601367.1 hypothetical protein [Janibacter hoylei]RWU82978.1 hypothetical protein CWN80_09205 [Janibacter hoylei PVAS-1]